MQSYIQTLDYHMFALPIIFREWSLGGGSSGFFYRSDSLRDIGGGVNVAVFSQ